MAENLGDRFATMSEEERRRFALEQERAAGEGITDLEFDDPRGDPGRTKASLEDRDGAGALVADEQHEARVREEARAREQRKHRPEKRGG